MSPIERQLDIPAPTESRLLAWEAPEFTQYERGSRWLIVIWVIALVLSSAALWYYHLTFFGIVSAIVPLAAAAALTGQSRVKPQMIRISLTNSGIEYQDEVYAWNQLKSFWFVARPQGLTLMIETLRRVVPFLSIEVINVDPGTIRSFLAAHLPEQFDRTEELGDRLSRFFRF